MVVLHNKAAMKRNCSTEELTYDLVIQSPHDAFSDAHSVNTTKWWILWLLSLRLHFLVFT